MNREPIIYEYSVPITSDHFDEYGHVAAPKYIEILFASRWGFMAKKGYDMKSTMKMGLLFPISQLEIKYEREINKKEPVLVQSWVTEHSRSRFWVEFQLKESPSTEKTYARGRFSFVCCDSETRKPMTPPDWVIDLVYQ